MMDREMWTALLNTLRGINIISHMVGCLLLVSLYQDGGEDTPQQLLFINLSSLSAFKNFIFIFTTPFDSEAFAHQQVLKFQRYLVVVIEGLIWFMCYISRLYITIDRLIAIWLDLKYSLHCTLNRTKKFLMYNWLLVAVLLFCLLFVYNSDIRSDYQIKKKYIYFVFDLLFLILAVVTFYLIHKRYRRAPSISLAIPMSTLQTTSNLQLPNHFGVFLKSRIYVSVLLIASYCGCKVTANFTFFTIEIVSKQTSPNTDTDMAKYTVWAITDLIDAAIYIFGYKQVKLLLFKELSKVSYLRKLGKQIHDWFVNRKQSVTIAMA